MQIKKNLIFQTDIKRFIINQVLKFPIIIIRNKDQNIVVGIYC